MPAFIAWWTTCHTQTQTSALLIWIHLVMTTGWHIIQMAKLTADGVLLVACCHTTHWHLALTSTHRVWGWCVVTQDTDVRPWILTVYHQLSVHRWCDIFTADSTKSENNSAENEQQTKALFERFITKWIYIIIHNLVSHHHQHIQVFNVRCNEFGYWSSNV